MDITVEANVLLVRSAINVDKLEKKVNGVSANRNPIQIGFKIYSMVKWKSSISVTLREIETIIVETTIIGSILDKKISVLERGRDNNV